MSNLSLREQLAALSGQTSPAELKKNAPKRPPASPKPVKKVANTAGHSAIPAWLERARYGVELLKAHFPLCFNEGNAIRPLKTGIRQDLVKQLGSRVDIAIDDKACMVSSLAYYVNSIVYHKSVISGEARIDLEGQIVGSVTAEEAAYSKQRLELKWQKKQSTPSPAAVPETSRGKIPPKESALS